MDICIRRKKEDLTVVIPNVACMLLAKEHLHLCSQHISYT